MIDMKYYIRKNGDYPICIWSTLRGTNNLDAHLSIKNAISDQECEFIWKLSIARVLYKRWKSKHRILKIKLYEIHS